MATPVRMGASSRTCAPKRRRTIPRSTDSRAVFVNDGRITCGWVVPDGDGSFFCFTYTGDLIGEFPTLAEAVRNLPFVDDVGACA